LVIYLPHPCHRHSPGFVGDPTDGIGYIDLSGFANDAGREVRYAIKALQHGATEIASNTDTVRDESGMVATDPTMLKVRIRRGFSSFRPRERIEFLTQ
jgi:hypothetical protein